MERFKLNIAFLVLILLLTWACTPRQAQAPEEESITSVITKEVSAPLAPESQSWQRSWEDLIIKARREGTVTVFSGAGNPVRDGLAPRLYERFGIRMEFVGGRGVQLAEKVVRERQAGIYSMDVNVAGSSQMLTVLKPKGFLAPLEPQLLLPEATDPKSWLTGGLHFIDREHTVVAFTAYPSAPLGINTDIVKPGDIKSYKDLLDPKWKGKFVMNDPTAGGSASKWFGVMGTNIMGWDFLRQLARQEPIIISDLRLQMEWLAQGKYPVLIVPHSPTMQQFREVGAAVASLTPEEGTYVTAGSGNIALLNRAPHPNAAKLFVNWLLTKEVGELWQRAMGQQSARLDVMPDNVAPGQTRQPGVKYFDGDNEELLLAEPEYQKLAKEILGPLMK